MSVRPPLLDLLFSDPFLPAAVVIIIVIESSQPPHSCRRSDENASVKVLTLLTLVVFIRQGAQAVQLRRRENL